MDTQHEDPGTLFLYTQCALQTVIGDAKMALTKILADTTTVKYLNSPNADPPPPSTLDLAIQEAENELMNQIWVFAEEIESVIKDIHDKRVNLAVREVVDAMMVEVEETAKQEFKRIKAAALGNSAFNY